MSTPNNDIFYNLKYIGYCWAVLPPQDVDFDFNDFVRYCKFQLCKTTNTLMLDPIWDKYEDEEIIAEYYAHVFSNSDKEREKFEGTLKGFSDDIFDWFDQQIEKNQKELKSKADELEEDVSFTPDVMGE
jgi:hypothetical protein